MSVINIQVSATSVSELYPPYSGQQGKVAFRRFSHPGNVVFRTKSGIFLFNDTVSVMLFLL